MAASSAIRAVGGMLCARSPSDVPPRLRTISVGIWRGCYTAASAAFRGVTASLSRGLRRPLAAGPTPASHRPPSAPLRLIRCVRSLLLQSTLCPSWALFATSGLASIGPAEKTSSGANRMSALASSGEPCSQAV